MYNYTGNILITIAGIYSGNSNLDWFIDAGGLYGVDKFYNTDISSCDGGRGG